MKKIYLLFLLYVGVASAQPASYTTANAHSHNDYEQAMPLQSAYRERFGSIEADVFLVDSTGRLWVAHQLEELKRERRGLDSLYLRPLSDSIAKNEGRVYAEDGRGLQLMIDLKTDAAATLDALVRTLEEFPALTKASSLRIVISGNRPSPDSFSVYPSYIFFDAEPGRTYSEQALSRIAMISAPFTKYSSWNGEGTLPLKDSVALERVIGEAHFLGKPFRLWAAPDNENAWRTLMRLRVDYINTDKIEELADFLRNNSL